MKESHSVLLIKGKEKFIDLTSVFLSFG